MYSIFNYIVKQFDLIFYGTYRGNLRIIYYILRKKKYKPIKATQNIIETNGQFFQEKIRPG